MKKLFLLFFATFLSLTSNVFGQGNTYNMVIKMSNGSTITLGSNDVESMTFDNGIITVSGINLDELINKLSEMSSSDVAQIRNEIEKLTMAIQTVQNEIQKGVIISSVTQTSDGIQIALSNGQVYAIHSGRDGKDSDVWAIGGDGYWYRNGMKTEYRAVGYNGKNGLYYVPNAETGCFDIYQDGSLVEHTQISFLSNNTPSSDIKNLQAQIDNLSKAIESIQEKIYNSYFIVGVSQVSNGISITLSNGMTYEISASSLGLEARIKALEEKVQQLLNQ